LVPVILVNKLLQRGNNRDYIFRKKDDKKLLLDLFEKYSEVFAYEILGYAIMDNHYHIVLRTRGEELSKAMHRINMDFAKTYNREKKRTGHVYEKRYKGILVKDDSYLLSLLRYVHQNPVKAKMCRRVADYKWSSDFLYRNNMGEGCVNIDFILDMFSKDRKKAIVEYFKFMDEETFERSEEFEDIKIIGEVISSEKVTFDDNPRESLDDILKSIIVEEADYKLIKKASRRRSLTALKIRYIEECLRRNYSMLDIGKNIGISQSAVSQLMN
jgi:REP element-mobilizing transposase RayT